MNTGTTTLRAAAPGDLPFVLRGERAYMNEIEPGELRSWFDAIDRNLALWIAHLDRTAVLEHDGEQAGYAMWTSRGDTATLLTLHVVPAARRRGLGTALMAWFEASARAAGCRKLSLGVRPGNPAQALYLRSGYAYVGREDGYLIHRSDLV